MACDWVHRKEVVEFIRPRIDSILNEVDDVKNKHEELLKIRRECLLNVKLDWILSFQFIRPKKVFILVRVI